ncbi:MAG TPA: AEC family transporter [Candidatus Copromonas faecavium]|uniref:AEC family transporter n=1 Tax=Candidatus Copromonas faecavium (nom. illeg.) TaxID=2840740 RepID=A0A9D1D5R1_9FIRM|nr:AEC family transporter [Candidatus Copromonas faecavium]
MDNFLKMLSTQAIMVVYMCIGYYCNRKDIIDRRTQTKMTDFVLGVTLPCMVFHSFNIRLTREVLMEASLCLGVAFFICFLAWAVGKVIYNKYPFEKKSILQYATLVNNSAFLGLPIVNSVLGDEAMLLATIFIIPNRIFMWTAGISIFTNSGDKSGAFKKVLMNPCMIAVYLGLIRSFTGFPIPDFLDSAIDGLGSATTPLSMLLIGCMMTELKFSDMKDWSTVYLGAVRLVFLPLAALAVMTVLGADEMMTGCAVILTAMPAGTTTALLAEKYGADGKYATKCLLTNILFSIITIPCMMLLV